MQVLPLLESGKVYSIYNRGNSGGRVFFEGRNYHHFLGLYGKYVAPLVDTFAYCLLWNHFHFLVRIKDLQGLEDLQGVRKRDPTRQFSNLFNAYAKSINASYHRSGSLFEKRFRRSEVTSESCLGRLICYIHHDPQRHAITDDFSKYPYSSFLHVLSRQPSLVDRDAVLKLFGSVKELTAAHKKRIEEKEIFAYIKDDVEYGKVRIMMNLNSPDN